MRVEGEVLATINLNVIGVDLGIPAPHSGGPVPGEAQKVEPLGTTFQPWVLNRLEAVEMENGYGLVNALLGANGLTGTAGTGP